MKFWNMKDFKVPEAFLEAHWKILILNWQVKRLWGPLGPQR